MTTFDEARWKEGIRVATALADTAPDRYQAIAFQEVLRAHAATSAPQPSRGQRFAGGPAVMTGTDERASNDPTTGGVGGMSRLEAWERDLVRELPDATTAAAGTRAQQSVWAVIRLLAEEVPADVSSIGAKIKTSLGEKPPRRSNLSYLLKQLVPRYLVRSDSEEGQAYVYRPSRGALSVFED